MSAHVPFSCMCAPLPRHVCWPEICLAARALHVVVPCLRILLVFILLAAPVDPRWGCHPSLPSSGFCSGGIGVKFWPQSGLQRSPTGKTLRRHGMTLYSRPFPCMIPYDIQYCMIGVRRAVSCSFLHLSICNSFIHFCFYVASMCTSYIL